jgi:transcriptional regulator with XRE-family HTH domain
MTLDAFASNLRRTRLQRGITLAQIAESTKVAEDLLEGLEQNDFSLWPSGIYARAFITQYALAIGVDAEVTVDEFCRHFPNGDRRVERQARQLSDLIGHRLNWRDDDQRGRRSTDRPDQWQAQRSVSSPSLFSRLRRLLLAHR